MAICSLAGVVPSKTLLIAPRSTGKRTLFAPLPTSTIAEERKPAPGTSTLSSPLAAYSADMKVNREIVVKAGLKLLNEVGLEQLTLRRLAQDLKIQVPTLYWHFKSKEELIDAMATLVLATGSSDLVPSKKRQ